MESGDVLTGTPISRANCPLCGVPRQITQLTGPFMRTCVHPCGDCTMKDDIYSRQTRLREIGLMVNGSLPRHGTVLGTDEASKIAGEYLERASIGLRTVRRHGATGQFIHLHHFTHPVRRSSHTGRVSKTQSSGIARTSRVGRSP